jgi:pentatricopeptide repeat domain-containing protein 3
MARQASSASAGKEEEIVIPPRIERGPTDILRALASTVGTDFTAPHYRYRYVLVRYGA